MASAGTAWLLTGIFTLALSLHEASVDFGRISGFFYVGIVATVVGMWMIIARKRIVKMGADMLSRRK